LLVEQYWVSVSLTGGRGVIYEEGNGNYKLLEDRCSMGKICYSGTVTTVGGRCNGQGE
ncbi:hypothetical protein HAX54_007873, partial [Datura stramonium]|nr:hypothetical protein [Datura stramonium]